ncbi:MAG: hypothetical protein BZY80_02725 [SAR202 cluster bacterium Io17-Chloro-G2]|nr:MAG: hypothetical protein BZY80_02725 [SAR202 cluster bacterium Io17-Chloro-G2]
MSIDTLIFDFDGVVIDTETPDFETWREVFQAHGADLDLAWWSQFIGGSSINASAGIFGELEKIAGRPVDREQIRETRRRRYLEMVAANPMLPGVMDYISQAKRLGLKLGIASSSNRAWVEGNLTDRGVIGHFDSISVSEDVSKVKPDPELYLLAASRLGTRPESAVAIEDSFNGVTAAKTAGMLCVAVPNPVTQALAFDHADLRLNALSDMTLTSLITAVSE